MRHNGPKIAIPVTLYCVKPEKKLCSTAAPSWCGRTAHKPYENKDHPCDSRRSWQGRN